VKIIVPLIAIVIFTGLYGCAAVTDGFKGAPTPIPDGGSAEAELYRARCGSCHSLAHPRRFTARQWESWLVQMERIMLERGAPAMTEEERQTIQSYLKDNARR